MAQTLQNQITYAKSMNGIISLSDGAGTTISNGTIDTDSLVVDNLTTDNFTTNNMIVNYMTILRDSNPVVNAALGSTVDIGLLVQNMIFDDINRLYQIWDDTATYKLFEVDVLNKKVIFNNSTVSFPNSNVSFNTNLPTSTVTPSADNQLITRVYADGRYGELATGNTWASTNTFNTNLPTSTVTPSADNELITRIYADGRYGELATANTWASTNTFNTNLPTSTVTPSADNELITRIYADGRYGELATANIWVSTNTFDNNLPTSTITTTTGATQFITRAIGDGRFGQLAAANAWAETNQFNKGILPCTTWSATNIQVGGLNTMGNRQTSSLNNVGIGVDTLKGDANSAGYTYSTGSRNTAIGNYALMQQGSGNDNVAIGYQAMQLTGLERTSGGLGITPYRCVAIGAGSQKTNIYGSDNISIGYNSLNSVGSGTRNIAIGSNTGNGLGNVSDNIIIGSNAMPSAGDNGIVCIGAAAMRYATGSANRMVCIGSDAGIQNQSGALNTFIGNSAGYGNTSGSQNVCLGTFAGRLSLATGIYMTCIGYDSSCEQSNEFSIGANSYAERAELTLPSKTRLACNQTQTGTTITLTFRTNENVLLTDATTTTINLPTPNTDKRSEGCKFYINRRVAGGNITINAPSGQTIALNRADGTYTTASSYIWSSGLNTITILCIGSLATGTTWQVLPATIPQDSIQSFGSVGNVELAFNTNINVLITSTSTNSITLPTPTQNNIGFTFNIYKTYAGSNIITVVAPATQHILGDGVSAASYNFGNNQTYLILTCIASTGTITWTARGNGLYGVNQQVVSNTSNTDYPLCFTTLSTSSSFNPIYGKSNLTYNPNTNVLTVPNVSLTSLTVPSLTVPTLTISNKTNIQTSSLYNTATVTLNFGSALSENIIIQSSTVTDINLPSPTDANIGCSFTITRAYIPNSAISINASVNDKITSANSRDGPTPLTSWFMDYSIGSVKLTLTKIGLLYYWILSYSRSMAILADTTSNINYPVLFGSLGSNIAEVYADSTNINYNPSTDTLNVNKVSATTLNATTLNATTVAATTVTPTNPILEKQNPTVTVSTSSNINVDPTAGQYSLYKFSNMGTGIITYRLPTITASTVGWRFMIKRFWGSNFNVCTINPSAFTLQSVLFDSVGAIGTDSFSMSTTQSMFEFVSTITQVGGFTGTFSNVAGSSIITINTITAGNIVLVGGILNLNGIIRTITGNSTGRGQTGNYYMNDTIASANSGSTFTSTESYGFILTNFN